MPREDGQFVVEDFLVNTGGLNTADSPFMVEPSQVVDGQNFDYYTRGAVHKRLGHALLNAVADSNLRSLGIGLYDNPSASRATIRLADKKIQNFDFDAFTFTNLAKDDSSASTDILSGSTITPGIFSMFNSPSSSVLWCAGAGAATVEGVVNVEGALEVTANGVPAPTVSSFTGTPSGSGSLLLAGNYRYALIYIKNSTSAESNASSGTAEISVTVTAGQNVALAWSLSNNDTTLFSHIVVVRSAINGAIRFTTGDVIATLASSATSYNDTGTFSATAQVIPRPGNENLDNSPLPSGTYTVLTNWKQHLVTAQDSTVYISDIEKSESWPLTNIFTVPTGGAITALASVSLTSSTGAIVDELLCIFKQRELWVLMGTDFNDFQLLKVDNSGCAGQNLVVETNGSLFWISFRGVYSWNGSGKPIYISQAIEDKFQLNGDIDKSKMSLGFGIFAHGRNEVQWYLSSYTYGEQQYVLKLDLRLTIQSISGPIEMNPQIRGVFSPDVPGFPIYAGLSCLTSATAVEEQYFLGDGAGNMYSGFSSNTDSSTPVNFSYITPYLNLSQPSVAKRFYKVVVWVLDSGSYSMNLNWWTNYQNATVGAGGNGSILISTTPSVTSPLIWGVSDWDVGSWDSGITQIKPITFNLNSLNNSNEGDCIRLQFSNSGANDAVVIYGYSIYYAPIGVRK